MPDTGPDTGLDTGPDTGAGKTTRRLVWAGVLALALVASATVAWRTAADWRPSRSTYPVQGVTIGAKNGAVAMGRLRAAQVDFAFFEASDGATHHNPGYAINRAAARAAGLRYGALHRYDVCATGSQQAANFIRRVPRDRDMLPPAIRVEPGACQPTRALMLSELTTFLNQIEAHTGMPTLLAVDPSVEQVHSITNAIERNRWAERDFWPPLRDSGPWVMWQANRFARLEGVDGAVVWNVVYADR